MSEDELKTTLASTRDYSHRSVVEQLAAKEDLEATLIERGKRYGVFTGHAAVTQGLKAIVADALAVSGKRLAPDQQESIDMIFHKVGRIINGDPDYGDSWIDIAGYAKLVADRLDGVAR